MSLIFGYSIFSLNLCSEVCLMSLKLQWQWCSCCDVSFGSGGGGDTVCIESFGEEMCKGAVWRIEV